MSETAKIKPLVVDEMVLVISRIASIKQTAKNDRPASFLFMNISPFCYLVLMFRRYRLYFVRSNIIFLAAFIERVNLPSIYMTFPSFNTLR